MKKLFICLAVLALFVPGVLAESLTSVEEIVRQLTFAPPPPSPSKGLTRSIEGARPAKIPELVLRLQFELNSDRIQADSFPLLENVATALKDERIRGYVYRIEGHTCDLGRTEYNQNLSLRRARSVKRFMVKRGLSEFQFEMVGFGESQPLVSNVNEAARQQNRRVLVKNTGRTFSKSSSSNRKLDVQVKKLSGAMETVVKPGEVLTQADNYAIEFQAGGPLHVYIFQLDAAGALAQVFPNRDLSRGANPVRAGEFHRVPEDGNWLHLDDQQGEERIIAMSSARPLADPKAVLQQQISAPQRSVAVSSDMVAYSGKTRGLKGARAEQRPDRGIKGIREDAAPAPAAVQAAATQAPAPKPAPNVALWQLVFQHR